MSVGDGWSVTALPKTVSPALISDDGYTLSFEDLHDCWAGALRALDAVGIQQGDVVALAIDDSLLAVQCLATLCGYIKIVPMSLFETANYYEKVFAATSADLLILGSQFPEPLRRAADIAGVAVMRVGRPSKFFTERIGRSRRVKASSSAAAGIIIETSGTVSTSKSLLVTPVSLLASAQAFASALDIQTCDRSLCLMPITHLHAIIRSLFPFLQLGASVICSGGARSDVGPLDLTRHKPTILTGSPAMFRLLLKRIGVFDRKLIPPNLRKLAIGSDQVSEELLTALETASYAEVVQFYGLSETAPLIGITPARNSVRAPTLELDVLPPWDLAVLDSEFMELPIGAKGEIAVRGGILNFLFLGEDSAMVPALPTRKGWHLTGDQGIKLGGSRFVVIGRGTDEISTGGHKISLSEIESHLTRHAHVLDVVAVGLPHPVLGEVLSCACVPNSQVILDEVSLQDYLQTVVPHHKLPHHVFIWDDIPRTLSGKIRRTEVVEKMLSQLSEKIADGSAQESSHSPALTSLIKFVMEKELGTSLSPDESFFEKGGDSFSALAAILHIEQELRLSIPPAVFQKLQTPRSIAHHLSRKANSLGGTQLVPIKVRAAGPILYVCPGLDGRNAFAFRLAQLLPDEWSVYTFNCSARSPSHNSADDKSSNVISDMCEIIQYAQTDRQLFLSGYSFGASLAVALALELNDKGLEIAAVQIIDEEADLDRRHPGSKLVLGPRDDSFDYLTQLQRSLTFRRTDITLSYLCATVENAACLSDSFGNWQTISKNVRLTKLPFDHYQIISPVALPFVASHLVGLQTGADEEVMFSKSSNGEEEIILKAIEACKEGDFNAEVRHYLLAERMASSLPSWAYGNLSEALFQTGSIKEAERCYFAALRGASWPISVICRFAPIFARLGFTRLLANATKQLGRHDDSSVIASAQIARFHASVGNTSLAEHYYRRSWSEKMPSIFLGIQFSDFLVSHNNPQEAIEILCILMRNYDNKSFLFDRLGRACLAAGDYSLAESSLLRAIEINPTRRAFRKQLEVVREAIKLNSAGNTHVLEL